MAVKVLWVKSLITPAMKYTVNVQQIYINFETMPLKYVTNLQTQIQKVQ